METAMLEEPALYSGRLVRPVVVEHEVDIEMLLHAPVDALEELDELLCTVPRMALADDQAGLHIERSKQRRGAVALVIVGHRRRAALLQRKARLGAIQRLNLALFVDAQHQRSIRWVHVEPDDISHLLFELWIVRYLEPTYQMRLEPSFGPDTSHTRGTDPHRGRHRTAAPVRRVRRQFAGRLGQDLALYRGRQRLLTGRSRLVTQQSLNALCDIALLPAPHARLGRTCQAHDRVGAVAVSRCKHDPRAPDRLGFAVAIRNDRFEPHPVRRAHVDADIVSPHGRTLADLRPFGNHV